MEGSGIAPPVSLGAAALRERLASGALTAVALLEVCLDRISAREEEIGAWAWIDPDFARHQARAMDEHRRTGRPLGRLHGLPVGIKDIVDTAKIPTENGAKRDAGRVPTKDAFIVERLKAEGAIILGKTVTTELAYLAPGKTRNPHDPSHTPGGSSSGSAAAVADGMVPLAIGTQTGGSVIRPAAFCGVTGYKPTFGTIPRRGIISQSPTLDTVGVFAADPLSAALLAETLFGHDLSDRATAPAPRPPLSALTAVAPPVHPDFAFVRLPGWSNADPELHAAFDELKATLGDHVFDVPLPKPFDLAKRRREIINFTEMARAYTRYYGEDGSDLATETREAIASGRDLSALEYLDALDWRARYTSGIDEILERCDAILCPAAPGPAPAGLSSTGDAIFNGLFTMTGHPAITLPLFTSSGGLPMGVQLVGRRGDDGRLLRTAQWLFTQGDEA